MKSRATISFLMVFLSFSLLIAPSVAADWWERGERPVYPRETVMPVSEPTPTAVPEATITPDPGNNTNNEDPCAPGKAYTGDYCGWSPRIGGNDSGGTSDPGAPPVLGLSYTGKSEIGLSDIMFLSGILCVLLYAKSKLAAKELLIRKKK